jgi:diguanylate cyclase (GGDEF)-like protein
VTEVFPPQHAEPGCGPDNALLSSYRRVVAEGRPDALSAHRYDIPDPVHGGFAERYWSAINTPIGGPQGVELIMHQVVDVTSLVAAGAVDSGISRLARELLARGQQLQRLNEELRDAQEQLRQTALYDALTGLLVRGVFMEELQRALARLARHDDRVAVLFLDLDRLKFVNDTLGHAAGDALISRTARLIRESVRPSDPVARFGGDEFVILLPDLTGEDEAVVVAHRILHAFQLTPAGVDADPRLCPSASVGIATTTDPAADPETLVVHADAAMYRAKQSGRGRWELFDPATYRTVHERNELEVALRLAQEQDQLVLHYQPIIDLRDGSVHAVEALLRWRHPEQGLLPAASFIDVAETMQVQLARLVVEQACRQLSRWDTELGPRAPRRVFCNLSTTELSDPELDHDVATALERAGLGPQRLVLEITERSALTETKVVNQTLDHLRDRGCELAIDDFGTGHSGLSRLVGLPAGILKIDQSFIHQMTASREATAVVSAVLLLAHNLRREVVAEGVEDAGTLTTLVELGCRFAQGYHLGRPEAAGPLTAYLAEHLAGTA